MYGRQEEKYYFGIQTENEIESDEDDNLPLSILKENIKRASSVYRKLPENSRSAKEITDNDNRKKEVYKSAFSVAEPVTTVLKSISEPGICTKFSENGIQREPEQYKSTNRDHDPTYRASCAFRNCRDEIWAACERCSELLCWEHFINNETCTKHVDSVSSENEENIPPILLSKGMKTNLEIRRRYAVDGEQREVSFDKVRKGNKRKIAHDKRIAGEAYVSSTSGKAVLAKGMKPRCTSEKCKSTVCSISDFQRQKIFNAFYVTKSLQQQREFIIRHVQIKAIKRKRTDKEVSRRSKTFEYHLPKSDGMSVVCKTMFLNTLGISEKTMRTALSKRTEEGIVEPDRRGGRHEMQADEKRKLELEDAYNNHTAEKISVRRKKEEAKETSKLNPSVLAAAVFDLQQVIQLPKSKESALFFRRRLSSINFTIYNIGNKECYCFFWDETISKRGASEISTCVARYLNELDNRGIKEVRVATQPHLPEVSDEFVHLFLHACYYSHEKTKNSIEAWFTIRSNHPTIFSNRDPLEPKMKALLDMG
ncbi:unnamed protein product [Ceutorhynchus assimilis]|uniref:Uncharacterized protein n=1 Tax=Ceutorhynchus assimilis TaxID=467358 RepID=A0A9N9MVK0_9CUCU|nr:unnamed protein product [Ceutorhynchus assimilis]